MTDAYPPDMPVQELQQRREMGMEPALLDVRESRERDIASLGGIHIPMASLSERLGELEPYKDRELVVYCRSGGRSAKAVQYLRDHGFDGARNLIGGTTAWSKEIDPSMPTY